MASRCPADMCRSVTAVDRARLSERRSLSRDARNPLQRGTDPIRPRLRWDPDLSPRVVGLSPQGWEDDHNEEEQAYPGAGGPQGP